MKNICKANHILVKLQVPYNLTKMSPFLALFQGICLSHKQFSNFQLFVKFPQLFLGCIEIQHGIKWVKIIFAKFDFNVNLYLVSRPFPTTWLATKKQISFDRKHVGRKHNQSFWSFFLILQSKFWPFQERRAIARARTHTRTKVFRRVTNRTRK